MLAHELMESVHTEPLVPPVSVLRNSRAEGILSGPHGGEGLNRGADAADALGEEPGVAQTGSISGIEAMMFYVGRGMPVI